MILSLPENLLASPSAQSKSDDLNNHMGRQTPLHYMAVTYMHTLYPSKLTLARLHVNNRNKQHQTAGRTYVRIKGLLSLCCILTFHVSAVVSVTYATEDSCSLRHTSSTSTDFRIIAAYRTTNESQNFPTNQLTNLAAMSTVVSPLSRLRWRQTIIQRDTHELLGKSRL